MLMLALLPLLAASVSAQFTSRCECALFNSLQLDPEVTISPVPLAYVGGLSVGIEQCDRPVGNINDCMLSCQQQFELEGGFETDLCTRTDGSSPRCTGSQWCEALHNSGITNVQQGDGINSMYYRMLDCEGTPFTDWQYGFREIADDGLCCNDGRFNHCTTPCESCEANNLCETGAFIASQFNASILVGTNPLPLQNVGTEFGPGGQFTCENWPGPQFGHPCDTSSLFASRLYKSNVNLGDPSSTNPDISTGDFYCQILKNRWASEWPMEGFGPEDIVTYSRMPGCDKNDGTQDHLKWNTARRYTCHHQALCCDGAGKRVRCEGGELL